MKSALLALSLFTALATAAVPVCTESANSPAAADCQEAIDTMTTTDIPCSSSETAFASALGSALSCTIVGTDTAGFAYCMNLADVKAAAQDILNSCQFTAGGLDRAEGSLSIGGTQGVELVWSQCGTGC